MLAYTDSPGGKEAAFQRSQQKELMRQQGTQLTNSNNLANATLKQTGELAALTMKDSNANRSFDREQASADRLLTERLRGMDADLADKRLAYDRETRSMDKRDRMIAQLMSGLGQLGGAFSL